MVILNYKRGISYINVPTSLLAMVDAAHGGKTALNFDNTKNIIGTFQLPEVTFIDPIFLKSLPEEELRSGFAEMIKHALIADEKYWQEIKHVSDFTAPEEIGALIKRSVEIKNNIVTQDPTENGRRKVLNFGHTMGHALESKFSLKHGHAIAIGMIGEAWIAKEMKLLSVQQFDELKEFIERHYPTDFEIEGEVSPLIGLMRRDKKNEEGNFKLSLIDSIGHAIYDQEVDRELLERAIQFIKTLT